MQWNASSLRGCLLDVPPRRLVQCFDVLKPKLADQSWAGSDAFPFAHQPALVTDL
jgi:hypothetical protein